MSEYTQSEAPAIALFERMGYAYRDGRQADPRTDITEVLLVDRLRTAIRRLNPWISEANLQQAFDALSTVQGASLMEINQGIWELIRGANYSVKQVIDGIEDFHAVQFIDYLNPENNDFLVVNQMKYHGRSRHSIPDLVVYLNGLPVAVIECKSPGAQNAWDKAYSDLAYYQQNSERLFHYNVICAGIWQLGGRYGAIDSPIKFYSVYKPGKDEDVSFLGDRPSAQDQLLYGLFRKERLLDIIRHFVIYELDEGGTVKKLPRYQQLRATNKAIARLHAGEGGVIWHTQGSGKSITMAYVTRKLQAAEMGFQNPTVVILTDRNDLDQQITNTFRHVGFPHVRQASSVAGLQALLKNDYGGIITTTLQKFQEQDPSSESTTDQTEEEERGNLRIHKKIDGNILTKTTEELVKGNWEHRNTEVVELQALSTKENLYLLVDEAHRSHYGFLAAFMRTVLPRAKFVAFTGTPISKEDKSTLAEFYGGDYIDTYTLMESVADGATVKLLYDEGIARLDVKKAELDKEFEAKFGHESEAKKEKLKRKALTKYQLSSERLEAIARHILNHFQTKIRPDGHKALLVCSGREQAIRYQQVLHRLRQEGVHDVESKVVVSLGSAKTDPIAEQFYRDKKWNQAHPDQSARPLWVVDPDDVKTVTEDFKLPFGEEEEREKSGKKKHDNTAILIVSDMLLTGYDVPIASCLYLDKPLKEHNLLQAIARVNRSGKGKSAGYIVDYNGITTFLIQALEIFSGDIRPDDILKNLNEEIPLLEINHAKLVDFFKPMRLDRHYVREDYVEAAVRFIEPIDRRDTFKVLLRNFNKSVNIVLPHQKALSFQGDFKLYNEIKISARNTFPDDEELKITRLESEMLQEIIDAHLKTLGVQNLLEEPISIVDRDRFKQEIMNASPETKELKMRNNLKHTIKVGLDKNPDFYKPLAQRLEELLKQREAQRINESQLIIAYTAIADDIRDQENEGAAKGFDTEQKQAVYSSMKLLFGDAAEDATRTVFDLIKEEMNIVNWTQKGQVKKEMENKIGRYLGTAQLDRSAARAKARELMKLIEKNHHA